MAGILSAQYHVFIAKSESAYSTDGVEAAFTANDDIVFLESNTGGELTPLADNYIPDRARASQSGVPSTMVKRGGEWSIPVPILGGVGTAFTPEYNAILKACGFAEDVSGGTTSVYTLGTVNDESLSLYMYRRNLNNNNWRLKAATGCVGNLSIAGAPGQEAIATASGQTIDYCENTADLAYFDVTDGKPLLDKDGGAITYTGTVSKAVGERMICKAATIVYNGVPYKVNTWSIDYAFAIAPITSQTGDPLACRITRTRDGASNANGELVITLCDDGVAYDDLLAAIEANEVATLSIGLEGSTTKLTLNHRIQFQARPGESPDGGAMNFAAAFIVVGDFASSPFGDNDSVWTYEAV